MQAQAVRCASDLAGYGLEVPLTSFVGVDNVLEQLTKRREPHTFISLLKDRIKDLSHQLDDEINKARYVRRAWSFHALSECATLLKSTCSPAWQLSEPSPFGFLWRPLCIILIG